MVIRMSTSRSRHRKPRRRPPDPADAVDIGRAIDHAMDLFGIDHLVHPAFVADEIARRFPRFRDRDVSYVTGLAQGRMAERLDLLQRMPGAELMERPQ
jgi:hypothetical protein